MWGRAGSEPSPGGPGTSPVHPVLIVSCDPSELVTKQLVGALAMGRQLLLGCSPSEGSELQERRGRGRAIAVPVGEDRPRRRTQGCRPSPGPDRSWERRRRCVGRALEWKGRARRPPSWPPGGSSRRTDALSPWGGALSFPRDDRLASSAVTAASASASRSRWPAEAGRTWRSA